LGAVQTGQLAAANAKLEQQVGALEILTNTFIYMESDIDRVCPESVSVAQYSPADVAGRVQFKTTRRVR
jgi:hypothetical protein